MAEILADLTPDSLAAAVEQNWREGFLIMMRRWPGGIVQEEPGLLWYGSAVPHPLLNGVLRTELPDQGADEQIGKVVTAFKSRRVPFWWWLFPSSRPADLGVRLERFGLLREADLPGMAAPLAALPEEPSWPEGLRIKRASSADELADWASAYAQGFPMEPSVAEAHIRMFKSVGLASDSPWRHYVGSLGGKPVASASVFLGAGVAGLYYVAVVPEARGNGVGKAMAAEALARAREEGYTAGVLQTTEAGAPLYRSLGFTPCGLFPQYRFTPNRVGGRMTG